MHTLLTEGSPKDLPICVWNPHEWFVVGRREVEKEVFKTYQQHGKYVFFTIGGRTTLDRDFKHSSENDHISINMVAPDFLPTRYYLNVFGDFLVEVFIDQKLADEIEKFYQKNTHLTPDTIKVFEELISKKYPIRMKISLKSSKATLLRRRLSKDFFVPKELRRVS